MAVVTTSQLTTSLKGLLLKDSSGTLVSGWTTIIADAVEIAYGELRAILVDRGYTTTQVDAWDDLLSFSRRLAIYYALSLGAGLHSYDDKFIEKLKPDLKRLETSQISINGTQTLPDDETEGMVSQTDLDTEDDTYTKETEL